MNLWNLTYLGLVAGMTVPRFWWTNLGQVLVGLETLSYREQNAAQQFGHSFVAQQLPFCPVLGHFMGCLTETISVTQTVSSVATTDSCSES